MSRTTRRRFLKATAAAGSSFLIMGTKASGRAVGANNRLRIGVCGVNGRGSGHIKGWMSQANVEVAYVIDVDSKVLDRRVSDIVKLNDGAYTPKAIKDVREALNDPNLDAISVATPNHWHSLITIWGAQHGKHVYVEKPMSHDVREGRIAVEAGKKYGVVIQHGTQRRSNAKIAGMHEMIKAGKFGRLKISYGYCCKPRGTIGFQPVGPPPRNLDWELWKGPAIIDQYHGNYVHYDWHWFWKTGNGDLNNQGTHQLDVARWAIDDDQTHPTKVMAIGGRFPWPDPDMPGKFDADQGETPNTMFAMAEYPNGQQVFFNVRNVNYKGYEKQVKNQYYFEDGGWIDSKGDREYTYYPSGSKEGTIIDVPDGNVTPGGNFGSFAAACRAGDPEMANGTAIEAHEGCVLGHLMNNSYRLGEKVPFNAKAGQFGDNKDATEHFMRLHTVMKDGVRVKDTEKYTVGPLLTFDPNTERHVGEFKEEANALLKDPNNPGFEVPTIDKI